MPAEAPTADELAPLLGETNDLDAPEPELEESGDAEYESAAITAVGTRAKATALKDAIEACLRKHGLLSDAPAEGDEELDELDDSATAPDIGEGFEDY